MDFKYAQIRSQFQRIAHYNLECYAIGWNTCICLRICAYFRSLGIIKQQRKPETRFLQVLFTRLHTHTRQPAYSHSQSTWSASCRLVRTDTWLSRSAHAYKLWKGKSCHPAHTTFKAGKQMTNCEKVFLVQTSNCHGQFAPQQYFVLCPNLSTSLVTVTVTGG
jgi:hypothetical protein